MTDHDLLVFIAFVNALQFIRFTWRKFKDLFEKIVCFLDSDNKEK